jgi:hypothetical protein
MRFGLVVRFPEWARRDAEAIGDLLLFTTFNSLKQAALVFTGIPFAVTGGALALLLRGMNFSNTAHTAGLAGDLSLVRKGTDQRP